VRGVQIGGAFNHSEGLHGVQIGGATNFNRGPASGAQVGGAMNYNSESTSGLQIGGAMNYSGEATTGVQIGGAMNYSGEATSGLQIGGAMNYSGGPMNGVQIAGALNYAHDTFRGLQIGGINMVNGHVNGLQIGAINFAASSDASIGAINIFWDGYVQAEVFGSGDGLTMAGIRHGSGAFYSVYHIGTRLFGEVDAPLAYGVGFGWRGALSDSIEFSTDLTATAVIADLSSWRTDTLLKIRPMIAVQLTEKFAVFGGPTVTVLIGDDAKAGSQVDDYAPMKAWQLTDDDSSVDVGIWPGVTAGVRFF